MNRELGKVCPCEMKAVYISSKKLKLKDID